jgi:fucose 4-O-acetylase-like acetyltransferase
VDIAKGIGIFFVVVGHVLRGLVASRILPSSPVVGFTDLWIYSWHMPLFFFLSGLFLYRSATRCGFSEFVLRKIRTIAYPYFLWSLITLMIKVLLGSIPNQPRELTDFELIFFDPIEQFWFLYVLFLLVVSLGALFVLKRVWLAVLVVLVSYPAAQPLNDWGVIEQARAFAPYLVIGVVCSSTTVLQRLTGMSYSKLTIVSVLGFSVPGIAICIGAESFKIAEAVSGIIGVISLSLILQRLEIMRFINFIGRRALEIYVGHTIGSAGARVILVYFGIDSAPLHVVIGIISGMAFPLALFHLFETVGFSYGLTFHQRRRQNTGEELLKPT